jgi:hypothetical protein
MGGKCFEKTNEEVSLLENPYKMGTTEVEEKKAVLCNVILCLVLS